MHTVVNILDEKDFNATLYQSCHISNLLAIDKIHFCRVKLRG